MNVAVGVYLLARTATKPPAVKLYRDSNEPVRTKTRLFHTQNGSLLLPSDTKRAQVTAQIAFFKESSFIHRHVCLHFRKVVCVDFIKVYGNKQIVLEKDEVDEMKKFDNTGLVLMGFKPMDRLKLHHHIRPAVFMYPEEEQVTGKVLFLWNFCMFLI